MRRDVGMMALRLTRRPDLTVLLLDDTRSVARPLPTHELAAPHREVIEGDLSSGVSTATGRWLLVVPPTASLDQPEVDAFVSHAPRRGELVVATDSADKGGTPEERSRRALTASSALIDGALARRIAVDVAPGPGADLVLRALAVARARSVVDVAVAQQAVELQPTPRTGGVSPSEAAFAWLDVFTRLDEIGRTHRDLRRPLLALKNVAATEIGRVVRLERGLRSTIFEEVERRGLASFSYRLVNVECATDLAIVYGFPPFLDTGGFVASRRFETHANAYDVVTQDMSRRRPRDDRSLELARRNLGRRMVVKEPLATGNWEQVERFCRAGMARIDERERDAGPYRTIYSRSMWIAPSVLAAWYKARNPATPWTAEISDPLAYRPNGEVRPNLLPDNPIIDEVRAAVAQEGGRPWTGSRFFEAVEWMIYSLADRIVFTNENQRDFMLGAFPDAAVAERARRVSVVEPHPVPRAELYSIATPSLEREGDRITIAYFGNFYGVRGVDDLIAPFSGLTEAERRRVRLLIFTPTPEETTEAVHGHPASDCVTVLSAQPYFDFLALTRHVDWLVLADAHSPAVFGRNPFLPSKLADYRGSGTPIWGIVEAGSVLSAAQLNEKSTLGDAADGTAALRRILAGTRGAGPGHTAPTP